MHKICLCFLFDKFQSTAVLTGYDSVQYRKHAYVLVHIGWMKKYLRNDKLILKQHPLYKRPVMLQAEVPMKHNDFHNAVLITVDIVNLSTVDINQITAS